MSASVTYHLLTENNAHWLAGCAVFDNPVDLDQLAAFVADPGHEIVFARHDGDVVGSASGTVLLHPDKPPAFFINEVDVVERFRRRGIAGALCTRLIARARDRGCKGLWLATEEENAPARALYRSLSARETEGIVIYDWDGALDA